MPDTKIILITGCSRGLGRALAEGYVTAGHTVVGCARSAEVMAEMSARHGDDHLFAAVDIVGDEAVAAFCERAIARFGTPDLVLNNAGIINRNAPLWEVSPEEFSDVLEVNVSGVTHVIRHLVPAMLAHRRGGVIVNFSSGWGRSTSPEVAPYCASKWAVEGLSRALAQDLPADSGIASVALNPGIIDTEMLRKTWGEGAASFDQVDDWAARAMPFLLGLSARDNGKALTAP